MNKTMAVLFIIFLMGCGVKLPFFDPLELRLLRVVDISPGEGEEIGPDGKVAVKFSRQLDPLSVSQENIFVAMPEDLPPDISKAEEAGETELNIIPGIYLISEDGRALEYRPDGGFKKEGEYKIILTSGLYSIDGIPFGGKSGKDESFASRFYVNYNSGDISQGGGGSSGTGGSGGGSGSGGNSGGGSSGSGDDGDGSGDEGDEEPTLPVPAYLMINEIYYDAPGTDTKGDLFIELYGEAGGYLEGYYIALVNGDDGKTYKTIPLTGDLFVGDDGLFVIADTDSDGTTNIADADFPANFDPQNGPDTIQLISPDGELVDVVGYGTVPVETAQNGLAMYEIAPAGKAGPGQTLSRLPGEPDSGDNSFDFVVNIAPSPGSFDVVVEK